MRNLKTLLYSLVLFSTTIFAQTPQGINYQATVRNSSGDLIVNQNIYFKFNVIQGSQTGTPLYTETHYVPTDDLGQVNLVIGQGTATLGTFNIIDWSLGNYFLGIEVDTGSGYIAMGTTQLFSVPYALYAETSGAAANLPLGTNTGDVLTWDGTNWDNVAMIGDATLTSNGILTIANNSVDGTDIALGSDAIGDIMYYNGTDWARLPDGAASQVLTTNGSGTLTWAAANLPLGTNTGDVLTWDGTNWVAMASTPASEYYPTVETVVVSNILALSTTSGGSITSDGGYSITSKGVCWSTNPDPTIDNSTTNDGTGAAAFTSSLTGLSHSTTYYYRAYATNSIGTGYGLSFTFTTATPPSISTIIPSNILALSAQSGGYNISDGVGGNSITAKGVCWSTSQNPTTADALTTDGTGDADFTSTMTGLTLFTTYYVRAYATNDVGTAYGNEVSFTTLAHLATLTTTAISNLTDVSATTGGYNISDGVGGSSITAKGVCWSTSQNPTTADALTTDGTGGADFTSTMTGLTLFTTYYVRAYATNGVGTTYGNEVSFTTLAHLATLTTTAISNLTDVSAITGGNITNDGGAPITQRGVCYGTSTNPTTANSTTNDGSGTGSFSSNLSGLTANTTYYVRAYATNSAGTAYGNEVSFTTPELATLTTTAISNLTDVSATTGGNVTNDGGAPITQRGVCYGTSTNPTTANSTTNDGSGTGSFSSDLSGLTANTTYYVRAYATNSAGTAYGNEVSFTTTGGGLAIGDSYQGGIIFYLDGFGGGLIAAPSDQSTGAEWGCYETLIGTGSAIGTGNQNTIDIVESGCGIAANICANLTLGGYSDWFLPSKDELNQMYLNKTVIGDFTTNWYWSSTETGNVYAWVQHFSDGYGGAQSNADRDSTFFVRAVRAF